MEIETNVPIGLDINNRDNRSWVEILGLKEAQ